MKLGISCWDVLTGRVKPTFEDVESLLFSDEWNVCDKAKFFYCDYHNGFHIHNEMRHCYFGNLEPKPTFDNYDDAMSSNRDINGFAMYCIHHHGYHLAYFRR